ncbi:S41 family peptidase [Sutcliffiella sp. NPDC057660]|uniref:S41 family peptidase n=1 Tax=Sutcliffiella sp. NPDC057660 TaxID=3346199 RepID=UPI0036C60AD1
MKKGKWLVISGIILVCLAIYVGINNESEVLKKGTDIIEINTDLSDGMVFQEGRQSFAAEISRISINNQAGNTFIQHVKGEEVTIEAEAIETEGKAAEYKISLKDKEMRIEVMEEDNRIPLNFIISVPEEVQEIDSQSETGNIRGAFKETYFVRFVTYFGNLITEYEKVNQQGEYISMTNVGQILTVLPDGTELNYMNQNASSSTLLMGVKENKSAVKFIATVRDAGWIPPQFIGKSYLEQLSSPKELKAITDQELKEDLEKTIQLMKEMHPYVKENPAIYEAIFEKARGKAQEVETREELYLILNEMMVATKDAHTVVHYHNGYVDFPKVKWTAEDEVVVINQGNLFQIGDKIESVGGKSISFIMEEARNRIPAEHEGYIKSQINSLLKNSIHLRDLGMVNETDEVAVNLERDGQEITVSIPIVREKTGSPVTGYFEKQVNNPYSWSIEPSGNYGEFVLNESIQTEMYLDMLKEFFEEMKAKNIPNLVVDLRDNGGGDSTVAYQLLSYINVDTISDGTNQFQNPKVGEDLLFNGEVYVLTSHDTFSAGTDFAAIFHGNGVGKLVGEPPGNNASYGGNIRQFTLENSGIYLQIPTTIYPAPVREDMQNQPLTMDYPVEVTRASILDGVDPWTEKIMELTNN